MGFSAFMMGELMARPLTRSCSFPNAMKLPDNVTAPMKVPSMMVTPTSAPTSAASEVSLWNSPEATSAEAPPPRPLKMATICGIAVIFMVRARTAPAPAPSTMPPAICA